MMAKTMSQLEMSYNLGSVGGTRRFVGTRWHWSDAYRTIIDRGTAKPRLHPGKENSEETGKSVYWPEEVHQAKRRDMGPYSYASQILLNPRADALQGFERSWLRYYKQVVMGKWMRMSRYILVDPSSSKKKSSDFTAMGVICLGTDGNYYLADGIRDRLNLTERAERLFQLHRKWKIRNPVRYEKYGMQADIEHIKSRQEAENYRFDIVEVGGQTKKEDRIGRLIPIFEQGKFYIPEHLFYTDYQKVVRDLVRDFIEEEYAPFPVGLHDDFLDMLSRIAEPELKLVWPKESPDKVEEQPRFVSRSQSNTSWMA
jgi:predicted phage terminase large subunit-like protein